MPQGKFDFTDDNTTPGGFYRRADFFSADREQKGRKDDPVNFPPPVSPKPKTYTISQITRMIKFALNEKLPGKWIVAGEVSNLKRHSSGHIYLTLKDPNCQLPAVMWKSAAKQLKFQLNDGMAVVATGRVDVYEPQGKVQFYIDKLEVSGVGPLELAFRQLAEKLRREGLFEETHKKPIPAYPATIAIVTSATGAAIQDISQTLSRRYPIVRTLLYPVAVQGESAAGEIAAAIKALNRRREELGNIDLVIVGRGGGSMEDLWAFNEEIVARAIYDSRIPIISAVGHEIDISIADMAADVRAATPTAAAELAVPVLTDITQDLGSYQSRLRDRLHNLLDGAVSDLDRFADRPLFSRPLDLIANRYQYLDEKTATLAQKISELLRQASAVLERNMAVVRTIEPHAVLNRSRNRLMEQQHRLRLLLIQQLQNNRNRLNNIFTRLVTVSPRHKVLQQRTSLEQSLSRLRREQQQQIHQLSQQLCQYRQRLENLDPRAVLKRGYSITRLKASRRILTRETPVRPDEILLTELAGKTIVPSKVISSSETGKDNNV